MIVSKSTRSSSAPTPVIAALVFVVLVSVYSLTYVGTIRSNDERLFISGAESLGSRGELSTGQVYTQYTDYVEPGQAFIGAVLYQITRLGEAGAVHILFLTNVYVIALTGVVVFLMTRQQGHRPGVAVGTALIFGLGTMAWPHTQYYFRDPVAMLFVALSAWSFERIFARRSLLGQIGQWGITLVLLACGILSKNSAAVILPVFLVVALIRAIASRSERRAGLIGLIGVAVMIGVMLLMPAEGVFARFSLARYVGVLSSFFNPQTTRTHLGEALVGLLVSPGKGIFVESPILLLALITLANPAWRDWRKLLVPWLSVLGLTLAVAYYQDDFWWGGVGWGVRHMLPVLPLLVVAGAPALQAILDSKSRLVKLAGGGLVLASVLVQVGAVAVSPLQYYSQIDAIAPGAAWTLAIWNPIYSEAVGFWQLLLQGRRLGFAWVRIFPVNPVGVSILVGGLILILVIALVALRRALSNSARRWVTLVAGLLTIFVVSVVPYGLLRAYYPDPYYSAGRTDFRAAAEYVAQNARPGDVVVVRGYLHPLWRFFLNYAHSPVPWYSFNTFAPKPDQVDLIRTNQSPIQALDVSTLALLKDVLPARYRRLWLVNDFGAAAGELRLEDWWLAQNYSPVKSEVFTDEGQTEVSLFALSSPAQDIAQPTGFQFGKAIQLAGYTLLPLKDQNNEFRPGDVLPVSLSWYASQSPQVDYNVSVQLLDSSGGTRVQQDGPAVDGFRPTSLWQEGETVIDNHGLALPEDLPPGKYRLVVALYDWQTGARLPAVGPSGPASDNLAYLTTIQIGTP